MADKYIIAFGQDAELRRTFVLELQGDVLELRRYQREGGRDICVAIERLPGTVMLCTPMFPKDSNG